MSKVAVVYWSGTGHTQAMAEAVFEAMKAQGADAQLLEAGEVTADTLADVESAAFGCPAMGAEVLEEGEFEPMFSAVKDSLGGKKIALFGSYGWGDGEWMRAWEDDCRAAGLTLACDSVICCDAPDEDTLASCAEVGKALAS